MLVVEDVEAPAAEAVESARNEEAVVPVGPAVAMPVPVPALALRGPEQKPSFLKTLLTTPALLAAAVAGALALTVGAGALHVSLQTTIRMWLAAAAFMAIVTLVAFVRAVLGAGRTLFTLLLHGPRHVERMTVLAMAGNLLAAALGAYLTLLGTFAFSRGRQLRRFGRVLLPGLRERADWTTPAFTIEDRGAAPEGLAARWRENGKTEHASVAAFARLTLDLMALGAPPALVAAANRDALDEIRHTEICFGLARALDGRPVGPDTFPQAQRVGTLPRARTLALCTLAVDSLVDGALHEGVSARIIARLAQRCRVPALRDVLREIAADEGRHSAHGWAVVAWCLEEGGGPVAAALLGAVRALPRQMRSDLPAGAEGGGWERWGIHGHALEAHEYTVARAHVVARVERMVAAPGAQAAA